MRLQPVRAPDPRDGRVVMARGVRHQSGAPMRAGRRRGPERAVDDRGFVRDRDLLRAPRAGPIRHEPGHPVGVIPIEPRRHRRPRDAQPRTDRIAGLAVGRRQHDVRALDHAVRGRPGAGQPLQAASIPAAQNDHANRQWHGLQSIASRSIIQDTLATLH